MNPVQRDIVDRDIIILVVNKLEGVLKEGEIENLGERTCEIVVKKGEEEKETVTGVDPVRVEEEVVTPVTAVAPVERTEEVNEEEDGVMKTEGGEIKDLLGINSLDWLMILMESNLNELVALY